MSDDAASLARAFARTLEDLRDRRDLQYVGAGSVPSPSTDETVSAAAAREEAPTETPKAEPAAAEVPQSEPNEPAAGRAERRPAPAAKSSQPPTAPTSKAPASDGASSPSSTVDPARREQAAQARRTALREQAKQWSPATKLEFLRRRSVGDCKRCPLSRTRNRIVFGVGSPEADLMFIGEAPGADEDRQGEPFVGRAGQLLNRWLQQLKLRREDVYIANVLKCRPPGNRDPRPEEVDRCSPFLQAQIRAIEPKVIVALGRHAGMLLSRREDMTLRAMRSTSRLVYDAGAPKDDPSARMRIPLVVTYHPAYVLRQEGDGRRVPDGRPSPTEMVMTDLRRALSIIDAASS